MCHQLRESGWLLRNVGTTVKNERNLDIAHTLALLASFLILVGQSFALDPTSHISQYGHSVWRVQDGYFGGKPICITQTTDGYIWVGTEAGLFRFDGVRFARWSAQSGEQLPSSRIMSLLGARDGSLWIGTDAGLAHLVKNRLILYEKNERWWISYIFQDRDDNIWIDHHRPEDDTHPLCQVLDTQIRCYGSKEGVDASGGGPIAQDASGYLWMGSPATLVRWKPGESTVYRPPSLKSNQVAGVSAIQPMSDGSLWVGIELAAPGAGLQHMVNGSLKPFVAPELNGETVEVVTLRSDRQNNLWVGTSRGLYRIRGTQVDHFGSEQGLSSDYVIQLFEDREGNIWVATGQGLDMFRDLAVKTISKREGVNEDAVESVVASHDGRVWIGTSRLQVLGPNGVSFAPGKPLPGNQVTYLFVDHSVRLWAGMNNKLFAYEGDSAQEITKPDGSALGLVTGITEDSEHNIWVQTLGPPRTLAKIQGLRVQQELAVPARKVAADPQSGIWLGLITGDLARYRNGQLDTFTFNDHPRSPVLGILAAPDGSTLGGTSFGVIAWKNGRQQILTMRNGLPCDTVNGLILDDMRNLWLDAQCGLIEIPNEQMQQWWEHPETKLSMRVFDTSDGVQPGFGHFNTATKTPDGRLWFANGSVVQVIDPAHIPENTIPPPMEIGALLADRKAYPVAAPIHLPPLTRDLEIDYTALSFAAPEKVIFRYLLEGHDAHWQEAGTRRQAFYNDLRPGSYHFRVIARNNNGVWNDAGASVDFSVLPAYYQTAWFRAACLLGFLLLLWIAYQRRVRELQRQFAIGLEARVNERTRIARELHDTLLQTFHGLMFQFQAARNLLPGRPDQAMRSLDDAIGDTEKALAESRGAIQDLRAEPSAGGNLADLLKAESNELTNTAAADHELPIFDLIEEGERRSLAPAANNEICRIAIELLRNAFHHANASRIEAEIRYDDQALRIRIRDNGRGIDPQILKDGGRAGHWGLKGVRERAERIGSSLEFWSESGAGTEVELTVPASVAYETSHDRIGSKLMRKVRGHAQHS